MLGRAAMILPLRLLPPARDDGLGAAVRRPSIANTAAGLVLAGIATLFVLPLRPAVTAIVLAIVAALLLTRLARSQIGGHTGDVLGATEAHHRVRRVHRHRVRHELGRFQSQTGRHEGVAAIKP